MGCVPSNDKDSKSLPSVSSVSKGGEVKSKTDETTQNQEKPRSREVDCLAIEEFIKSKGKPLPQWDKDYLSKC
jgi:hypothetical protein